MKKNLVIIGLGLIGGSLAERLYQFEDYQIIGVDIDPDTVDYATYHHVVDRATTDVVGTLAVADLVILCLHPRGIVDFLTRHGGDFKEGCLITDVCGVKTAIMKAASSLPPSVSFIGGHPMAGKENSGIEYADYHLFDNAHYILTPYETSKEEDIALLSRMALHLGCRDVVITTPENHDAIIAYTSQVMHIMAVAVCDDPDLFSCKGFEGGSFRDCTRVAALDVPLWTDLFSMNAPALCKVISQLEENLASYRRVLESGDREGLSKKLTHSSERKRRMNLE